MSYCNMDTENTVRLHPDDMITIANLIASRLTDAKNNEDRLMNLKELASDLGISYSTLSKKRLPYNRLNRNGRKLYKKSEVLKSLTK